MCRAPDICIFRKGFIHARLNRQTHVCKSQKGVLLIFEGLTRRLQKAEHVTEHVRSAACLHFYSRGSRELVLGVLLVAFACPFAVAPDAAFAFEVRVVSRLRWRVRVRNFGLDERFVTLQVHAILFETVNPPDVSKRTGHTLPDDRSSRKWRTVISLRTCTQQHDLYCKPSKSTAGAQAQMYFCKIRCETYGALIYNNNNKESDQPKETSRRCAQMYAGMINSKLT